MDSGEGIARRGKEGMRRETHRKTERNRGEALLVLFYSLINSAIFEEHPPSMGYFPGTRCIGQIK